MFVTCFWRCSLKLCWIQTASVWLTIPVLYSGFWILCKYWPHSWVLLALCYFVRGFLSEGIFKPIVCLYWSELVDQFVNFVGSYWLDFFSYMQKSKQIKMHDYKPHKSSLVHSLVQWIWGRNRKVNRRKILFCIIPVREKLQCNNCTTDICS